MADEIASLEVRITGDASDLEKVISQVESRLSSLTGDMQENTSATESNTAVSEENSAAKAENANATDENAQAVEENTQETEENTQATDENTQSQKNNAEALQKRGKQIKEVGESIDTVTKPLQVASAALAAGGVAAAKYAIDFEDAFASVEKTVDGTPEQLEKIKQGIIDMSTVGIDGHGAIPLTTAELNELAAAGGQLGIQTENILSFTETMAMLGTATNLVGEDGASTLARYLNVMDISQDEIGNVGSAIVDLGNNSATTEAEIAEMALRMGKYGNTVRMGAADVLGYSAALSSLGIEAQLGGSAIGRTWLSIETAVAEGGDSLKAFAKYAGVSAKEFKQQWNTDSKGAFNGLLKGLQSAESLTLALADMGISNTQDVSTIMSMVNGYDLVVESVERANTAYEENTALQEEFEKKQETTASQLAITKNNLIEAARSIGETFLPTIKDASADVAAFAQSIASMSDEDKQRLVNIAGGIVALGAAAKGLTVGVKGIGKVVEAVGKLAELSIDLTGLAEVGGSMSLTAAFVAPFIAMVGVAKVAGTAIENYHAKLIESGTDALKTAEEYSQTAKDAYDLSKQTRTVEEYADRYKELMDLLASGNQTDESENERKAIEQWFIDNYGEYISAEEQKNGVHQETIDYINEIVAAEERRAAAEKQAQALNISKNSEEKRENAEKSAEELPKAQQQKSNYEEKIKEANLLKINLEALRAEYQTIDRYDNTAVQKLKSDNQELFDTYFELTGRELTFPGLDNSIENIIGLTDEWGERVDDLDKRVSGHEQSIADYKASLVVLQETISDEVLRNSGYDSLMDLFNSEDTVAKGGAIATAKTQCQLLGMTTAETAMQVSLLKNGFKNLDVAIASGDLDGLKNDFVQLGTDMGLTIEEINNFAHAVGILPSKHNITITAEDETDEGVESAQNNIDSVKDKKVTISVATQFSGTNFAKFSGSMFAKGTDNAPGGLALVNDEKGVSDPSELTVDKGRAFIPDGKDVLLPLSKGAKVYTASQTQDILKQLNVPRYASGKNNSDAFTSAKEDWTHYTKTHSVTTGQELERWLEFQQKYKENEQDIYDIEEQVFSLRQKLYKERVSDSESWLRHEEKYNGMSVADYLAGIDRMREYTAEYYEQGILSHKEYNDALLDLDEKYLDKRKEQIEEAYDFSTSYISEHTYFNDWLDNGDDPLSAYSRVKEKLQNALSSGELTQSEYDEYMSSLGSTMLSERTDQSMNWLSEQRKYFGMTDEEYVEGLERIREYTQQYYAEGLIGRQEYNEAMTELNHEMWDEAESAYDEMLSKQQEYISKLEQEYSDARQALQDSWDVEDRAADMADVQAQLDVYKNAVTSKGQQKYKELQEQMKQLQRDEELYQLELENNEIIEKFEAEYEELEASKTGFLKSIAQNTSVDVSAVVGSLEADIESTGSDVTSLLTQLLNAVSSFSVESNSYTDMRSIVNNISQASPQTAQAIMEVLIGR